MFGGVTQLSEAAAMVTTSAGPSEGSLLRELVGDRGDYRGEEMEEDSGSELSKLESSEGEMEVEEEWEGKGCGRPNFKRATAGARQQQSTQEFFRRGVQLSMGELNIFNSPGKTPMRGALARLLSTVAASSSPQQGRPAQTLNLAKEGGEGLGMEGSKGSGVGERKGAEGMDVAVVDWAEEMANQSAAEMRGMEDPDRLTTPTPTPARWGSGTPTSSTPRPVPVTPIKGSKRMAVGTPRRARSRTWAAARPIPAGFAAASALEQILAAIAGVERKMEEKVTALEARVMEGMGAWVANENEREVRVATRLLADAEEREKRLAVKLLALDAIKMELTQKSQRKLKQWEYLTRVLETRRRDIREVRQAVDSLASEMAQEGRAHQEGPGAVEIVGTAAPTKGGATQPMEGVVATAATEEEVEQGDDTEGVEREGLYESKHAPAPGEPVLHLSPEHQGKIDSYVARARETLPNTTRKEGSRDQSASESLGGR